MVSDNTTARDPYLWQNDDVLKNRLNIHEKAQLRKAELAFSAARLVTLELGPKSMGLPYLCHIHRTLFQDVYHWAGELRTLDLWREEMPFCHFEYIEKEGNALMEALEEEEWLVELPLQQFVLRLAHYYAEIDMLHPFREGNERSLRIFFEQLALHAGYLLDWNSLSPEEWERALLTAATGDEQALVGVFTKVVSSAN